MTHTPCKESDLEDKSVQYHLEDGKAQAEVNDGADYSGAVAKTDPAEIALVKKLDWRIMPTLWAMYFFNYVRLCTSPLRLSNRG